MNKSPSCPVCGFTTRPDRRAWSLLALDRAPRDYVVHRCGTCGLRWLDPMAGPEDCQSLYGQDYYEGSREQGGSYREDKQELIPCHNVIARRFRDLNPDGPLLDLGCATGEFLEEAARLGIAGAGLEPSRYAARVAQGKGLDVHEGTLESFPAPPEPFGAAHCSHVLEHVPDAHEFLRCARGLLQPGAPLYIEVPLQFDGVLDVLAHWAGRPRHYSELSIHHHYFFTPRSLNRLLIDCGFEVVSITTYMPCRRQLRRDGLRKRALQTLLWAADRLGARGDVISLWARRGR